MPKKIVYDQYYQTRELFGLPYPELIKYFSELPERGKLLDLGCGQGRNAIPLAELGYEVVGMDHSKVGIEQMLEKGKSRELKLKGQVEDIYAFENFAEFDFILLDSMLHFEAKDKKREIDFINRIIENSKPKTLIAICIQHTGKKVNTLLEIVKQYPHVQLNFDQDLEYEFIDQESEHSSRTNYKMLVFLVG